MEKSLHMSTFRKIAVSLWAHHGDPSVYGFVELDISDLKKKSELMAYVIKSLGETMHMNPDLNTFVRWGRIESRKEKSISVMVNICHAHKNDLSALNIENVHLLTIEEIKEIISNKACQVRANRDAHLGPMLKIIRYLPRPLMKTLLKIYEFFIYELDTRLGLSFLPHRPFGSIIVSNVGSLGIKNALLPLVPLARASLMVSVGRFSKEPRIKEDSIFARDIVQLGITFDHRLFDGSHAAKMLSDFENSFYSNINH
jgi:hypothetical protein